MKVHPPQPQERYKRVDGQAKAMNAFFPHVLDCLAPYSNYKSVTVAATAAAIPLTAVNIVCCWDDARPLIDKIH